MTFGPDPRDGEVKEGDGEVPAAGLAYAGADVVAACGQATRLRI